ncbi:MAG: hypothetical protein R2856_29100 [Caldilineaceae bacterium]
MNFEGMPAFVHLPLALLFGILGGVLWGAIPGILKVYTGAHEVIVTIMLNYVAALFAGWTVLRRRHPRTAPRPTLGSHGGRHLRNRGRAGVGAHPLAVWAALPRPLRHFYCNYRGL